MEKESKNPNKAEKPKNPPVAAVDEFLTLHNIDRSLVHGATTPAPSLEVLPPEMGAVLELHSTGSDEFDGKLVEYIDVDKKTGKYKVRIFKLEGESMIMMAKPKTCRRPGIKPLELRHHLHSIAWRMTFIDAEPEQEEKDLNVMLELDPCCASAYLTLAYGCARRKNGTSYFFPNKTTLDCIQYFRRGLANVYAYGDIIPQSTINLCAGLLTHELQSIGHVKAGARVRPYQSNAGRDTIAYQLGRRDAAADVHLATLEYDVAECLFKYTLDLEARIGAKNGELQIGHRTIKKGSEAADRFINFVHHANHNEKRFAREKGDYFIRMQPIAVQNTIRLLELFDGMQTDRKQTLALPGPEDDKKKFLLKETVTTAQKIIHLVVDLYKACASNENEVNLLSEEQRIKIDELQAKAFKVTEQFSDPDVYTEKDQRATDDSTPRSSNLKVHPTFHNESPSDT
ncbi:MAG: hypothetical protein SGILL_009209, partial [Bacillariaceae sp.]